MPRTKKDAPIFIVGETPSVSKHTGKEYSENTLNTYRTRLNTLANKGIVSVADLAQRQEAAIKIAQEESKGDSNKMRVYLSAMLWALTSLPAEAKGKLHSEYEKHRTFKNGNPTA
jgi:hypothetical protein